MNSHWLFLYCNRRTQQFLDKIKVPKNVMDREVLINVARTSLRTKIARKLADPLTEQVVDAVRTIQRPDTPIDLFMVEILQMIHKAEPDTTLVSLSTKYILNWTNTIVVQIKGLVLDHGGRHPEMPKRVENAFILTCNVSLEYEKTEVNTTLIYTNAEEKERMVEAERKLTDDRVRKIIALKRQVSSLFMNTLLWCVCDWNEDTTLQY